MIAARWLKKQRALFDLIYIDGSHDEPDVYYDLVNYWELLAPGGVIFGDDYDQYWPSVVRCVDRFALERELFWILRK